MLSTRTTDIWLSLFAGSVPAAPINDVAGALENEFVPKNARLQTLEHPQHGAYRMVAHPVKTAGEVGPSAPAPKLGEHTDELLEALGYGTEHVDELRRTKVI